MDQSLSREYDRKNPKDAIDAQLEEEGTDDFMPTRYCPARGRSVSEYDCANCEIDDDLFCAIEIELRKEDPVHGKELLDTSADSLPVKEEPVYGWRVDPETGKSQYIRVHGGLTGLKSKLDKPERRLVI